MKHVLQEFRKVLYNIWAKEIKVLFSTLGPLASLGPLPKKGCTSSRVAFRVAPNFKALNEKATNTTLANHPSVPYVPSPKGRTYTLFILGGS